MSTQKVIVQSRHVIFDDKGQSLSAGNEYTVQDGPIVEAHILNGLLTVVSETQFEKVDVKEEQRKINSNKTPRLQETETLIQQENANG